MWSRAWFFDLFLPHADDVAQDGIMERQESRWKYETERSKEFTSESAESHNRMIKCSSWVLGYGRRITISLMKAEQDEKFTYS